MVILHSSSRTKLAIAIVALASSGALTAPTGKGDASARPERPTSNGHATVETVAIHEADYPYDYTDIFVAGSHSPDQMTVRYQDPGVYIVTNAAGISSRSCQQLTATEVRCTIEGLVYLDVRLGGGRDRLDMPTTLTTHEGPQIDAGSGSDTVLLRGSQGDFVIGGAGNDVLVTGAGSDSVFGGTGRDLLRAGAGNDGVYTDDTAARGEPRSNRYVDCGGGDRDYVFIEPDDVKPRNCESRFPANSRPGQTR